MRAYFPGKHIPTHPGERRERHQPKGGEGGVCRDNRALRASRGSWPTLSRHRQRGRLKTGIPRSGTTMNEKRTHVAAVLRREASPLGRREASPLGRREASPLGRREASPLGRRQRSPLDDWNAMAAKWNRARFPHTRWRRRCTPSVAYLPLFVVNALAYK